MTSKGILYDTDFLIALLIETESTHAQAKKIYANIRGEEAFLSEFVLFEFATVLSRKLPHPEAIEIVRSVQGAEFQLLQASAEEKQVTWELFFSFQKKNISFVDCHNVVLAKKYQFRLASFDAFYPKELLLS